MVVGVCDAQHSQAVSSVCLRLRQRRAPLSGTSPTPVPPSPRAPTHAVDAHDVSDFHGDYSDGLLASRVFELLNRPFANLARNLEIQLLDLIPFFDQVNFLVGGELLTQHRAHLHAALDVQN